MKRVSPFSNASLLMLLTSAIAGCGSSGTVLQSGQGTDAQAIEDGSSPRSDSASGTDGSLADATGDAPEFANDAGNGHDANDACGFACSPRRPFLVGSSMRTAGSRTRSDWIREISPSRRALDAATSEALATSWLRDALEEHASIAAFARFSMHLLSVGAPPDLVLRSQRASLDEIHHARTCFAFAERYSGVAHGPAPLVVHDSMRKVSLAEIAALTAEEGCVGETLGAALAAEQLAVASDPETIAALRKIAADESRHAELAWRFVKWAVVNGGHEVKTAVARAMERAIASTLDMEIRSYAGIDLDAWHAHGRLTCQEARAAADRTIREVVRPCLRQVLGQPDGAAALTA